MNTKVLSRDFYQERAICRVTQTIAERLMGRVSSDIVQVMQYAVAGVPFLIRSSPMEIRTEFGYGLENDKILRKIVVKPTTMNIAHGSFALSIKEITYGQETEITIKENPLRSFGSSEVHDYEILKTRIFIALSLFDDSPKTVTESVYSPSAQAIADEFIFDKGVLSKINFDGIDWLAEQVKESYVKKYSSTRVQEILAYCAEHEFNELTMDILRICEESGIREATNFKL